MTAFLDEIVVFFTAGALLARGAIWVVVALVVAALMEPWAAFAHNRLWHTKGILWSFHKSHHSQKSGRFEKNDWLSLTHAPVSIALIIWAVLRGPDVLADVLFGAGAGMALFGLAYVAFHDGMVHGRLPLTGLQKYSLFAGMRDAHLVHHQRNSYPYGFFLGVWELSRAEKRAQRTPSVSDPVQPAGALGADSVRSK